MRTEEELTTTRDAGTEQTIQTKTSVSPSQAAQESTTRSVGPAGETMKSQRTVGMSAEATNEYTRKKTIFHAHQVIWYIVVFIEILLAFRFFLKITAANPTSGFTRFIYDFSGIFSGPFAGIYPNSRADQTKEVTSIIEWGTLTAAVVYVILAWAVIKIFKLSKPTRPDEVEKAINQV